MIRNPIPGNALTADEATKITTMNSKLYVGNLSFNTTETELRDAFGQFGSVTDVHIANDRETGRPRGFAFVTFSTDTESKLAAEKMNGTELDGRQLTVNEAKPKEAMGGGGTRSYSSPDRRAGAFQARGKRY
jgi:RNA recognition motif-containing protein